MVAWKRLSDELKNISSAEEMKSFNHRYDMALNACYFAAFLLSPTKMYVGISLTESEKNSGIQYFEEEFPISFMSIFFKFQAKIEPFNFNGAIMREEVISAITDFDWWKSFITMNPVVVSPNSVEKLNQLLTAVSSSAGSAVFNVVMALS